MVNMLSYTKKAMASLTDKLWYRSYWLPVLLWPLAALFYLLAKLKRKRDQAKARPFAMPVVVVGNISVGGTGKTPVVIALVKYLQSQGFKPAVVSRGFGGRAAQYPYVLNEKTTAAISGDEPLLIYQQCRCPVVVDADRNAAINRCLNDFDVDIIISDDGLQHYKMHRDLEWVVVDGARGLGNGWCLPAGPLRETAKRLKQVDQIIINGELAKSKQLDDFTYQSMHLEAQPLQPLTHTVSGDARPEPSAKVHAVAGIGNPQRFFNTLRSLSFEVIEHSFADHHAFSEADVCFDDDLATIMTEKDAVKCQAFKACNNHWYLPVEAALPEQALQQVKDLIDTFKERS